MSGRHQRRSKGSGSKEETADNTQCMQRFGILNDKGLLPIVTLCHLPLLKFPQRRKWRRRHVEQVVEYRYLREHQQDKQGQTNHQVQHQTLLSIESLRVLSRAVVFKCDVEIVSDEAGDERDEQNQFEVVPDDKHTEKQTKAGRVK